MSFLQELSAFQKDQKVSHVFPQISGLSRSLTKISGLRLNWHPNVPSPGGVLDDSSRFFWGLGRVWLLLGAKARFIFGSRCRMLAQCG